MKTIRNVLPTMLASVGFVLAACMPTTPTDTSSTLKTVIGPITGFGSVFVNGVEYNTDRARIKMDGLDANLTDLSPGMKVTLTGTDDGTHGVAHTIDFEDDLEGTVDMVNIPTGGSTGTITIMGQTVEITAETVFDSEVLNIDTIDKIGPGMVCEVSGHAKPDGTITATFIEVEADTETNYLTKHTDGIHVKGLVSNLDTSAMSFELGMQAVDYTNAKLYGFTELANDIYVVVRSTQGKDNNGVLIADVVGIIGDGDWGHDWKIGEWFAARGKVSADLTGDIFEVDGQKVQLTPEVTFRGIDRHDLVVDTYVAVEGKFDANGVVQATKVIGFRLANAYAFGMVSALTTTGTNTGTVTVGTKTFTINNDTIMKDGIRDESHTVDVMFNLQGLAENDFVVIKYFTDTTSGEMIATYVVKISFSRFSSLSL